MLSCIVMPVDLPVHSVTVDRWAIDALGGSPRPGPLPPPALVHEGTKMRNKFRFLCAVLLCDLVSAPTPSSSSSISDGRHGKLGYA